MIRKPKQEWLPNWDPAPKPTPEVDPDEKPVVCGSFDLAGSPATQPLCRLRPGHRGAHQSIDGSTW